MMAAGAPDHSKGGQTGGSLEVRQWPGFVRVSAGVFWPRFCVAPVEI
jgi:hypothetical protein